MEQKEAKLEKLTDSEIQKIEKAFQDIFEMPIE